MAVLIEEMRAAPEPGGHRELAAGIDALATATTWLVAHGQERAATLAGAVPYLELAGIVAGGWLLAREAEEAKRRLDAREGDAGFNRAKLATARFYAEQVLATAPTLLPAVMGGETILGFELEAL